MTVLVVARADSMRSSLQTLLGSVPDIGAVEMADELGAALAWIGIHQPRLVLLDLYLLGDDVWSALRQIQTLSPRTRSIVLVDDVEQQWQLARPAAEAVLLKGTLPQELVRVVEALLTQPPDAGGQTGLIR